MKKQKAVLLAICGSVCFEQLFYGVGLGVNLLLFVLFAFAANYAAGAKEKRSITHYFLATSLLMLAIAFGWHGNQYSLFVFFIISFLWLGSLAATGISLMPAFPEEALFGSVRSQMSFIKSSSGRRFKWIRWRWLLFGSIFLIISTVFIGLYSAGNIIFEKFTSGITDWLSNVFENISLTVIFTLIAGLFLSNWFVFHSGDADNIDKWSKMPLFLKRKRIPQGARKGMRQSLMFEYRSGVILFAALNLMLLVLNISDVYLVWFGFKWEGQLLKDFVHTGTWNLIVSILISVGIMLFYFRRNQNFFPKPLLRKLSYAWIAQNMFLALSLVLRNWHYIANYGLAYRRIGVYFFLLAVLGLLVILTVKILKKERGIYFVHRNLVLAVAVLFVSALPDWSAVITAWNFSHYKQSFVHTEFLANMPDRCLPQMLKYKPVFSEIEAEQKKLGFKYNPRIQNSMPLDTFLEHRISQFVESYPLKSWREKTWAEARAIEILKQH